MAYIDVLPLAEAKLYLRIDDTQNETDAEITSMIKSALSYIERHTNIMLYARDKEFLVKDGCVKVYDHPINSVVKGIDGDAVDVALVYKTNYNKEEKTNHINYYSLNSGVEKLVLNVGYSLPANVPSELIDLAKVMVDVMFYEKDSDRSFKQLLPMWANDVLNSNKRHLI